jgi:hypothetical protein
VDRNRLIGTITPPAGTASIGSAVGLAAIVVTEVSRLTPRDRHLLDLLDQHATFTTEQLAALAFGTVGRARVRLNTLHQRGILDRFRHYQRPGSQSWRWTLGPVGAAIIAATREQAPPRPSAVRDATARLAVSPTLGHRLGVNGFFVALSAYARTHDEATLLRWWSEPHTHEATGSLVRPDGHGVWAEAIRRVPFWLELDLGTEPLRRVAGKLGGYAHLAGTRRAFPVLFWLPSAVREANLHALLTRTGVPAGVTVATGAADHAAGAGGPAGVVWQIAGHPGRVRLAELPVPMVDGAPWGG